MRIPWPGRQLTEMGWHLVGLVVAFATPTLQQRPRWRFLQVPVGVSAALVKSKFKSNEWCHQASYPSWLEGLSSGGMVRPVDLIEAFAVYNFLADDVLDSEDAVVAGFIA